MIGHISEVIIIKLSTQSKRQDVIDFLEQLHAILRDNNFDIDTDVTLIRKGKTKAKEKFSTPYTLLDLDYDVSDVVDRLNELTVQEYSETLFDKDDVNPPLLFVFGKDINNKQVYVKLKIKGEKLRHVLCVSFHYAEAKMSFPYA